MALIPEDGTGLTAADTYATEAELSAYAAARGITIAGTAAQLLIIANDYIETKNYIGDKYSSTQALQWPRMNAVVDGYYLDRAVIPQALKDAQMEVALSVDAGTNPMANVARQTKREKVDVIEVEYMDGAADSVYLMAAETKLRKLIRQSRGAYRV